MADILSVKDDKPIAGKGLSASDVADLFGDEAEEIVEKKEIKEPKELKEPKEDESKSEEDEIELKEPKEEEEKLDLTDDTVDISGPPRKKEILAKFQIGRAHV